MVSQHLKGVIAEMNNSEKEKALMQSLYDVFELPKNNIEKW